MCDTVKTQLLSVAPDQKWRMVTYREYERRPGNVGTLCHMIVVRGVLSKSILSGILIGSVGILIG